MAEIPTEVKPFRELDKLSLDRTKLANERTFLAYFRTFIVFLSSGIAIFKVKALAEISGLGIFLSALAPLILIIGIVRYYRVKKRIKKYYQIDPAFSNSGNN